MSELHGQVTISTYTFLVYVYYIPSRSNELYNVDEKGRCADGFPVNPSPVVAGGAKKSNYAMYGFLCEQPLA